MSDQSAYTLEDFLPYLLTQAADALSYRFQTYYKEKYGILRTEWRVLFHLGSFGDMTAKEICDRSRIHKTKVSRAVTALENKGYLTRQTMKNDRRHSLLKLTRSGHVVFQDLFEQAQRFDAQVQSQISEDENLILRKLLEQFIESQPN